MSLRLHLCLRPRRCAHNAQTRRDAKATLPTSDCTRREGCSHAETLSAEVTWQVLVLLLLRVISLARVLASSSGWCSQTARHTHVTDTPSLHGGKGSPSGVRCRRLLDIRTWLG